MKIADIILDKKEYSFYSWITTPLENADFEFGQKRFFDAATTVNEVRLTESGYNVKVTFHCGFVKYIYLTEDCEGEALINGVLHKYKIE